MVVVSVLAFYSDNPSSNLAGYLNVLYEKTLINKKRPGLAHLKKQELECGTCKWGRVIVYFKPVFV